MQAKTPKIDFECPVLGSLVKDSIKFGRNLCMCCGLLRLDTGAACDCRGEMEARHLEAFASNV